MKTFVLKILFLIFALASLGCGKKNSQTQLVAQQPANILAVQPNPAHLVGPPFPPPSIPYPIGITKVNGDGPAHVGAQIKLEVQVTDGAGAPLPGAYVRFERDTGPPLLGLGTCTTDVQGLAWVTGVPTWPGQATVTAFATATGVPASPVVTFTVIGQ